MKPARLACTLWIEDWPRHRLAELHVMLRDETIFDWKKSEVVLGEQRELAISSGDVAPGTYGLSFFCVLADAPTVRERFVNRDVPEVRLVAGKTTKLDLTLTSDLSLRRGRPGPTRPAPSPGAAESHLAAEPSVVVTRPLPGFLPEARLVALAQALFAAEGARFTPGAPKVVKEASAGHDYTKHTTYTDGERVLTLGDRVWTSSGDWEPQQERTFSIVGLRHGVRVEGSKCYALGHTEFAVSGPAGAVAELEDRVYAAASALVRAAPRTWRSHPTVPPAWAERAHAAPFDVRGAFEVMPGIGNPILVSRDAPTFGIAWLKSARENVYVPFGPLPAAAPLCVHTSWQRDGDAGPPELAPLLQALTGAEPSPLVTAIDAPPGHVTGLFDDWFGRSALLVARAGDWVLRRIMGTGELRSGTFAIQHEAGGELALLGMYSTSVMTSAAGKRSASEQLWLCVVGANERTAPARGRLRAQLTASGWRPL